VLTTYGNSSGFAVDPIEKKPLYHFYPGSRILSFGTAGCNLGCRYCQNWDLSAASDRHRLGSEASPQQIVKLAGLHQIPAVAFTYNDPVVFAEYAIDTAQAAREVGIQPVAVTAGYLNPEPRREFFAPMAATNIDLKAIEEDFYWRLTGGHLKFVLETISYVHHQTETWLELTNLVIPGYNDSDEQLTALASWVVEELGPDVPVHFSAFHPDFKMRNVPPTPVATLHRAREIGLAAGLHYVYVGNVDDPAASSTYCPICGTKVIGRDRYRVTSVNLEGGACPNCRTEIPGRF
jgi:pyruvate formate lyase activating enzyme